MYEVTVGVQWLQWFSVIIIVIVVSFKTDLFAAGRTCLASVQKHNWPLTCTRLPSVSARNNNNYCRSLESMQIDFVRFRPNDSSSVSFRYFFHSVPLTFRRGTYLYKRLSFWLQFIVAVSRFITTARPWFPTSPPPRIRY